jgi:hypothetical protein
MVWGGVRRRGVVWERGWVELGVVVWSGVGRDGMGLGLGGCDGVERKCVCFATVAHFVTSTCYYSGASELQHFAAVSSTQPCIVHSASFTIQNTTAQS